MTQEEKARAYDEAKARMSRAWNDNRCTIGFMNEIFPELKESEDEKIKREIISIIRNAYWTSNRDRFNELVAWLEKQGNTAKEITCTQEVEVGNGNIKALVTEKLDSTNTSAEDDVRRRSTIQVLEYARSLDAYNQCGKADIDKNIAWLEKPSESDETTEKDDTLLDLLNKMPSCITVDGIDYHFVMKKTIAYMAFYEGDGEGSGKVIFWMAGDPIAMLTAMLEKLKEKGLLE